MATYKPWTDKSFLYNLYTIKKKSIDQIAEECKKMGYPVTSMTIYNNLKKFDLIKNSRNLGSRKVGGNSNKKGGFYG